MSEQEAVIVETTASPTTEVSSEESLTVIRKPGSSIVGQPYERIIRDLLKLNLPYHAIVTILKQQHSISITPPTIKNYAINYYGVNDQKYQEKARLVKLNSPLTDKPQEITQSIIGSNRDSEVDIIINDIKARIQELQQMRHWSIDYDDVINSYYKTIKDLRTYQHRCQNKLVKDEIETKIVNRIANIVVNVFIPKLSDKDKQEALDQFKKGIASLAIDLDSSPEIIEEEPEQDVQGEVNGEVQDRGSS